MKTAKQNLPKKPVLLLGDVIYDVHHYGKGQGISIEASIPVATHQSTTTSYGGAGLVARNILALGKPVFFITVVGGDYYGRELSAWRNKKLTKRFFIDRNRTTITKERFIIHGKKVLRWNRGDSKPVGGHLEEKVSNEVKRILLNSSIVLISDYRHGFLSQRLAQRIIKLAHQAGKEVWVDSQVTRDGFSHQWYMGADFICVNQKEVESIDKHFNTNDLPNSLKRLQKILKVKNVTIKLGARGSVSLLGKEYILTSSPRVREVDAVGAGDAFFAALAKQGEISPQSLAFASRWAALATTVSGTEPPKLSMLKKLK